MDGRTFNPRDYHGRQRAGVLIDRINLWTLRLNVRPSLFPFRASRNRAGHQAPLAETYAPFRGLMADLMFPHGLRRGLLSCALRAC
jgi:hypothetical protein